MPSPVSACAIAPAVLRHMTSAASPSMSIMMAIFAVPSWWGVSILWWWLVLVVVGVSGGWCWWWSVLGWRAGVPSGRPPAYARARIAANSSYTHAGALLVHTYAICLLNTSHIAKKQHAYTRVTLPAFPLPTCQYVQCPMSSRLLSLPLRSAPLVNLYDAHALRHYN
eukprot:scaffold15451_cov118-Isochrysis_galbana.AAC.1